MAYINGSFAHFPAPGPHAHLNGARIIRFDIKDLLRSVVRVGKRNALDLMKYRYYACMEMQYKIAIIRANLTEDPARFMIKTGVYEFLDPSEKGNLSYYFGLAFAHMIAEQFLDIPWLMHLDVYHRGHGHHVVVAPGTNVRPDLFGQNAIGDWYVIEAKGRSGGLDGKVKGKAKAQTRNVRTINGISPTRIASVIYFMNNRVNSDWTDPDEVEPEAAQIDISQAQFFENYYLPFISVIGGVFDDSIPESREDYYIGSVDSEIAIGLLKSVYDAYKARQYDQIPFILQERPYEISAEGSFGRDGTVLFVTGDALNSPRDVELALPLGTSLRAELLMPGQSFEESEDE